MTEISSTDFTSPFNLFQYTVYAIHMMGLRINDHYIVLFDYYRCQKDYDKLHYIGGESLYEIQVKRITCPSRVESV